MKSYTILNLSCKGLFILVLILFSSLFSSCTTRQARVLVKIINELANNDENGSYDGENVSGNRPNNENVQSEVRYSITGVVQYDNGYVVELNPKDAPIIIKTANELFMYGGGLHKYYVRNNDIVTITETYALPDNSEYEYSFGETATRPRDVSFYSFICEWDDRIYFFNVNRKL